VHETLRLLARNHEVSLLVYAAPDEVDKATTLRRVCAEVHVVPPPVPAAGKRVAQLLSMLTPVSYQRRNLHSVLMQQRLDELAARKPFDVIQVESSPLASFDFDRRAAVVLVEHDIVYELLYRMYEAEQSPIRRLYNRIEFSKVKREEIDCWRRVSACVTTSAREERIVRQFAPHTPIAVVPNAVDVDYFHPSDTEIDDTAIVMTGFMKTRPNIDGAIFFVRDILPRILAVRPNTVFHLVGRDAPAEVRRLAGPHVVIVGAVPDVRPYVHKSAVFVVPLRMGSGTRLKVLEGLAMRKPMVSTSLGCEGIDTTHREHLLIADDPAEFAAAVVELLDNKALATKLAMQGRAMVLRDYRWETAVARLEELYGTLRQAAAERGAK
jgi:glycosyltransferase involved in cell wall biosynthesis